MKLKYVLVTFLMFISIIPNVNALCGSKDMIEKKEIANDITITAQYAKDENGKDTGKYNLVIEGLVEEFYIIEEITDETYYYNETINGTLTISNLESGNYRFHIYYEVCEDELVKTIKYKLPKYNHYANNPLCEGITEDDLAVCNRLYQGELTDEIFEQKIEEYKKSLNIETQIQKGENNIVNKIMDFFKDYYIYIIAVFILIIVIIIRIVVNKKRGALE